MDSRALLCHMRSKERMSQALGLLVILALIIAILSMQGCAQTHAPSSGKPHKTTKSPNKPQAQNSTHTTPKHIESSPTKPKHHALKSPTNKQTHTPKSNPAQKPQTLANTATKSNQPSQRFKSLDSSHPEHRESNAISKRADPINTSTITDIPANTLDSNTQSFIPEPTPESSAESSQNLDTNHTQDPTLEVESVESNDPIYTPLPLQIKPQDILSAHALKDSQQNITLEKTTNEAGFTIIDVYDSAKVLRAKLSFKNGVLEGVSKAYQNGQIAREIPYKNGLVDGIVITYLSPTSRTESAYRAGKKHGRSTIYHNDTPISFKEYRDDILHGLVQAEIKGIANQSSKSYTQYRAGKKQGESTGYTDNQVVFRQYYDQGMLQGVTQTYGENEIIKISREYKNNLLHGEEIVYNYPQQTPMHKSHYELGVLVSPYEIFNGTGESYFSMKPNAQKGDQSLRITKQTSTPESKGKELWLYDNNQSAMEISKDSGKTHVRTFYKNGTLASDCTITPTQASGSFYAPDSQLESKILYIITPDSVSKTTWLYAPKEVLLTKSQESNITSITQSYRNGMLDSEITTRGDREITIQKKFFPNGKLEFEHKYIEDKMVQGTLFAQDGSVIYTFPHTSEDMIFDEAFPNTAAKKRAQVFPRH